MNKKKHGLHRVVAFLLALLLCLSGLPANGMTVQAEGETSTTSGDWTSYASTELSGDSNSTAEVGSEENPYLIKSAADLAWLAKNYTDPAQSTGKYFKIDPADGSKTLNFSAHYWIPIARFGGHLDGNGVSITGLKIGSETAAYTGAPNVGLFGRIDSGSVVENLSIDVAINTSNASAHYVGGIAGISNGGTIDSCTVTGSITGAGSASRVCVGGMVGRAQGDTVIINCINEASVNATATGTKMLTFAAGIAGQENGNGSVKVLNSCNMGSITADAGSNTAYAGGIVVIASDKTKYLLNCYNAGTINASSTGTAHKGSIAGQVMGNTTMNYLYWLENNENTWYGNNSGATITGIDAIAKNEAGLKALAGTLNSNITAIKNEATLASLNLKTWAVGSDGYPLPGAVQSGSGEPELTYVAQIKDGEKYGTLQEAIDAAENGAVITLLDDVVSGTELFELTKSVTLDLNGNTLTASYFAAYNGTKVEDNSGDKTGLLKVAKDNFIFDTDANNTQMPVYNGKDGYVFVDIEEHKQRNSVVGDDTFELIFKPSFGTGTVAQNTLLAAGGESAKISIRIRLEWTDAEGNPQSKDLEYTDTMVQDVYGINGKAFYIKASGANSFPDLKITPLVQSKLDGSIEWLGTTFSAN